MKQSYRVRLGSYRAIAALFGTHGYIQPDEEWKAQGGKVNGQHATDFPFPVTKEWLARGRQRYEIFCAVCHGSTGDGFGMIVQRGFVRPPAFFPVPDHQTALPQLYAREVDDLLYAMDVRGESRHDDSSRGRVEDPLDRAAHRP